ncbi:DNA polymerase/3'-5' exonuclease PolX [Thermoflexibacter ruber]|uniref:DNA polymerase (Family 10) n=1 Tax=Thermoflexibacter ruber TaxID=1003 RepID=A0A1I2HBK7_9BACT|nr:DNA polymerase/3'-5' exonuclease PolX [Thermoflexibacter ruber]SFF25971.1 DNA polymerase (family 10) [Thermoflexibacter ruber]
MLTNDDIAEAFKLTASLMDLHGENPFKAKSYNSAVYQIEKLEINLAEKNKADIVHAGISEGMASKIVEFVQKGTFSELQQLLDKTPKGVLEMLSIKGLGGKKVKTLWDELKIESIHELLEACNAGKVAQIKGFGEKTQEAIIKEISFRTANADKMLYANAEPIALALENALKSVEAVEKVNLTGQIRRRLEIIDEIQLVVSAKNFDTIFQFLNQHPQLIPNKKVSSPFAWRGYWKNEEGLSSLKVEVKFSTLQTFVNQVFVNSAAEKHLSQKINGKNLLQTLKNQRFESEEQIYQAVHLPYLEPELREGFFEFKLTSSPTLLEMKDLKGCLHNHSTYSDGKNSLLQMAQACIDMGLAYFGICDHSQTAFYANGLTEERVIQQHAEIEKLNQQLAPFKILKGIESDILPDGRLDYPEEILKTFDFIVASVHSGLKMDKEKATARLIKAIENPYTTILGHPTGRLLLRREGYPLDFEKIIDACVANHVVIEINANPWRLDLDWRWVHKTIEKGAMLSINPDAHEIAGLKDMYYGVLVARKGGASKENILNTMSLQEIENFFSKV